MFRPFLLVASALASMALWSCLPTSNASGRQATAPPVSASAPTTVRWAISPPGGAHAYTLSAFVNGKATTVDTGGEFFDPKPVAAGNDSVPANAISGFSVPGPDGEDSLYYAVESGSQVFFYRLDWDPFGGGFDPAQLVKSVAK